MDNLYANVPRDLGRVKSKLFLNLTKRQILCFSAAIAAGLPLYFLLRKAGNATLAAMVMILVMLPFFFLAMYEKNGQPLEVILKKFITARFRRPRIRTYRTKNYYRRKNGFVKENKRPPQPGVKKQKVSAGTGGRKKDRKEAEKVIKKEAKKTERASAGSPAGRKEEDNVRKE